MKKRMFDPEIFSCERLAACGQLALPLYLGLLSACDVEGKLEDRPQKIKVKIFPYFDVDIESVLTSMVKFGLIVRYEVEGVRVILVTGFNQMGITYNNEKAAGLPNRPDGDQLPTSCLPDGDQLPTSCLPDDNHLNINNNINNSISIKGECEGVINTPTPKPRKSKQEYTKLPDELPPTLEAARADLNKWLKWKESRREGYQKIGLDTLLVKLAKFESKTIMDAIEDSISNGWKGLFPEKITRKNSAPFRETQHERNQRILRENHEKYSQPLTPFSTEILFLTEDK